MVSKYYFPLKELGLRGEMLIPGLRKYEMNVEHLVVPESNKEESTHDRDTSKERGRQPEGVLSGQV